RVDTAPMHVPPYARLLFPHHGNVVFRLAGENAVVATHALVQVDGHTPGIGFFFVLPTRNWRIQGFFRPGLLFLREVWFFFVFVERGLTNQRTRAHRRIHGLITLGCGQLVGPTSLAEFDTGSHPWNRTVAQRIRVKTHASAGAPGTAATIA